MPVTQNTSKYSNIETQVYEFLSGTCKFNNAICCGILANIERECDFNPNDLNSSSGAYGLIQWTSGRKSKLINFCKKLGVDKSSVIGQLRFLVSSTEFSHTGDPPNNKAYDTVIKVPNTKQGAYEAGYQFSKLFERHGIASEDVQRGNNAAGKYWNYYQGKTGSVKKGYQIVAIAKEQLGKPYEDGSMGPDTFDNPGLINYCYGQVGIDLQNQSVKALYQTFLGYGKIKRLSEASAGDLLFYRDGVGSDYSFVAIATGTGKRIYIGKESQKVVEDTIKGSPTILRRLADSDTGQEDVSSMNLSVDDVYGYSDYTAETAAEVFTFVGGDAVNYVSLTTSEDYGTVTTANLKEVEASGYDYGYLIDMTHGGSFKFYLPEFTESAGANWSNVDIVGRSVSITYYQSTSSRKVTISLDLYAGAGLYNNPQSSDIVGKLHSDLNFVKSLEYPDYSAAIARPPSRVHLILGSSFNMAGVVSDVTVEHLKPLDSQNRSMYAKLSFTVTQVEANPPDYKDIRNGQFAMIDPQDVSTMNSSGTTVASTNDPSASSPSSVEDWI